jgi:hypothetical protein
VRGAGRARASRAGQGGARARRLGVRHPRQCDQHRLLASGLLVRDARSASPGGARGQPGKELPQAIGNRQALLDLQLEAHRRDEHKVEEGFLLAAKFPYLLHVYLQLDLPDQTQLKVLAAIFAELGDAWEHEANRVKLVRWHRSGVLGELSHS